MDMGGELYSNPKIRNLFTSFGYEIYPTSPDSSNQNGPVERSHRTISQGIKALLFGAGLDVKFWPYAFIHVLRIRNAIPGQGQDASPLFLSTGKKDNFRNLRIFGCRVWVRPTGLQRKRFKDDVRKGIFLGYVPHTDRLIMYYDCESERVKITSHCKFDEDSNDLPIESVPLGFQQLVRAN